MQWSVINDNTEEEGGPHCRFIEKSGEERFLLTFNGPPIGLELEEYPDFTVVLVYCSNTCSLSESDVDIRKLESCGLVLLYEYTYGTIGKDLQQERFHFPTRSILAQAGALVETNVSKEFREVVRLLIPMIRENRAGSYQAGLCLSEILHHPNPSFFIQQEWRLSDEEVLEGLLSWKVPPEDPPVWWETRTVVQRI